MRAFYSGQFVLPLPPGHRFPMGKYALLREPARGDLPRGRRCSRRRRASDGELALAHTPGMDRGDQRRHASSAQAMREIGFPWSEAMVERSRRSVGATIAACRAALAEGVAANMAGGTHHASADKGGGFCVFNDAAVAARLMQAEHGSARPRRPLRVAVIDLDVHQGNGTARIFRDDPSVFTLSLHGAEELPVPQGGERPRRRPARRLRRRRLPARAGARAGRTRRAASTPGLVIYLAGADPHEGDRLGRLKLSLRRPGGARPARVRLGLAARRIPLAFAMAGGYGAATSRRPCRCRSDTFRVAFEYWRRWQNRPP